MAEFERCKIGKFSNCGIKVLVYLCSDEYTQGIRNWVEVELLDINNELIEKIRLDFNNFGKVQKFVEDFRETVHYSDLAGGDSDIYGYLERFSVCEDIGDFKYYVID